ncbi:NUDIX hydrolase [Proteiniborus sp. MB09-C3]|uniref:NUDIX hydrolase n=1 Tax=Proteiniborus sp. MB09-C3 TaxID=3050072 RepID=UPI0025574CB3|nr:NUDIX hydrolase [Proteiniborus sp. MB09-C3]WIV11767.1 NUDIX hydrolase [Proteiniborus sp. MB09-C3]
METIRNVINVVGAIYRDNKWLMIKRSEKEEYAPGTIAMVGGKVENEGEEYNILENTLRREVMEEVGIELGEDMIYVESIGFISKKWGPVVDVVFLCKHEKGEPYPASPNEVAEVYWMTIEEILENEDIPHWVKDCIKKSYKLKNSLLKGSDLF